MLLFSYANWDELLRVCIGLCGNLLDGNPEGIKDDNQLKIGEKPVISKKIADPVFKVPEEAIEVEEQTTPV